MGHKAKPPGPDSSVRERRSVLLGGERFEISLKSEPQAIKFQGAVVGWQNVRSDHGFDAVPRSSDIELASRYAGIGSCNGKIPYGLREMAEALNCSKATAMRALKRLQDHGFVVRTKQGSFTVKLQIASEWRLTEFPDDVTGDMASKEFARWSKNQNTVSPEDPAGCRDETDRVSRRTALDSKTLTRFRHSTR